MVILAGVAAAAYFIMKKKASNGDTVIVSGGSAAPASTDVLSSWLNGLSNLVTKPAPAPAPKAAPAPSPAPAYDNHATAPAPAPAPSPWTGNGGGAVTKKNVWNEALNRLEFFGNGGGYIDYATGITHYNDGSKTSSSVGDYYMNRYKQEALGTWKPNFLGV